MHPLLAMDLNMTRWELWFVPLVGLTCTGLIMMGGRLLFGRRSATAPASAPTKSPRVESQGSPKRRQTPRGRGRSGRVLVADPHGSEEPYAAYVVNLSMGGLCIAVPEPLAEGSMLSLKPAKNLMDDTWYPARVKFCRPGDSGYEIGCEFVGRTSGNIMLVFS